MYTIYWYVNNLQSLHKKFSMVLYVNIRHEVNQNYCGQYNAFSDDNISIPMSHAIQLNIEEPRRNMS